MTLDRHAVERAVKASSLAPPSRLLMHTLLTHVTRGTLVVPAEYAPSLTKLVEETGLSRSAVTDHLNILERDGWLDRHRPTAKEALADRARTAYRLKAPASVLVGLKAEPVREADQSEGRTSPSGGLVQEESQVRTSPSGGPVREADQSEKPTSPSGGLVGKEPQVGTGPGGGPVRQADSICSSPSENYKKETSSRHQPATPKTDTPPREDVEQLCNRLLSWLAKKNYRRRPRTVSAEWRDEARRLLDLDKIPLQEALAVLDWSQRDGFWTRNINSMPTFREQYGQLEIKSRDARGVHDRPPGSPVSSGSGPSALPPRDGYKNAAATFFGGKKG